MSQRETAETVFEALLERVGEAHPRPRIEPVRRLAELCGSPQREFRIIQVAGTNGKTSVSRAIESLLRAHGFRTGLFTSPHLVSFTERISIDGEPIDEQALVAAWQEMQPALTVADAELAGLGQSPITFFEALAVLGFVAFADAPVEIAVIEVGMGGEWDATNVADAEVAVFTPIDLDHTEILGSTLQAIARTKAGIITPGSTVVTAAQQPEALAELTRAATQAGAKLHVAGTDFSLHEDRGGVGGRLIGVTGTAGHRYEDAYVPLLGMHQSQNALLAVAAVEALFGSAREIPQHVLEQGLAELTSPGRLQLIGREPAVLVDAAHNPHGARTLADAVRDSFDFRELTLVLGVLDGKDARGVAAALAPLATQVYVTGVESERSLAPEDLAETVGAVSDVPVTVFDTTAEALDEARGWAGEDGEQGTRAVLVAGSVILAGEAIAVARADGWLIVPATSEPDDAL